MAHHYEQDLTDVRPGGLFLDARNLPGQSATYDKARKAARRHSSRVRLLKWLLPIGGILIVLAVVLMTFLSSLSDRLDLSGIGISSDGIVMENPKLSGHDGKSHGYEVTAARAIQSITDPNKITLHEISGKVEMGEKDWIRLTAREGVFDRKAEILDLSGDIVVTSGSGYRVTINSARVDMKNGTLASDLRVAIHSEKGTLAANHIKAREGGRKVTFEGDVHMTLVPGALGEATPK